MSLGPFDVSPERIEALGAGFTQFVNLLLRLEVHAQRLAGYTLAVTANENVPDGGVDAGLRSAGRGDWLPPGASAWQFKRSDLAPKKCADEFGGATWAHEYVREGGSYVVVLGASLPDNLVERRRRAIAAKAIELGLLAVDDEERIRVYDANRLARWASRYPALAVSRLIGGPGDVAVDYARWASVGTHSWTWVPDVQRAAAIDAIRGQLASDDAVEIRIQGDSGIGKTRLVLEALNTDELRPLVAYVHDERSIDGQLLNHLVAEGRIAVLVVDECAPERHIKLVEQIPRASPLKLVTIGDGGPAASRSPAVEVEAMPSDAVEEFLKDSFPQLRPEAVRFVSAHCQGNMRWAIVLANRVSDLSDVQAADVIRRDDIEQFVAEILPEGRDFFSGALLALLERVGWDGDKRNQLELLARFAGQSIEQMEAAGAILERGGLLVRQGRYRAVGPQPLAVYLAAEAWRQCGRTIVTNLLPDLDAEMALSLFRRVADLGRFEPASAALPTLLAADGPFASLEQIEGGGVGSLLTHLAIVLPEEVALHLSELIEAESIETLRTQSRSRRDLVWTLEKLVWHRRTFELAANSLLRLACAENETWANNASGTWIELFGLQLPGTAATPPERIAYLDSIAHGDPSEEVRALVVKAATRGLSHYETIGVSGELQGGVLVEPRGMPTTWDEVRDYRVALISLLKELLHDEAPEVGRAAEEALLDAVQTLVADHFAGEPLADVLSSFGGEALRRLRQRIADVRDLYDRARPEDREVVAALERLTARLPVPTPSEELNVLVHQDRWTLQDGERQRRIEEVLASLREPEAQEAVLGLLSTGLNAGYELGYGLRRTHPGEAVERALLANVKANGAALVGYLMAAVDAGQTTVFDDFLDAASDEELDLYDQVAVAARGPVTDRARARIFEGLRQLSIREGTSAIFGWQRNLTDDEAAAVLDEWLSRVATQQDYDAVLQWVSLRLHEDKDAVPGWVAARALTIVLLRRRFPAETRHGYDWSRLALTLVGEHGAEVAQVLLDSTDSGSYMLHRGSYDSEVLLESARAHPEEVWNDVSRRIGDGSWRVEMSIRSWLLHAIPPGVVETWIGENLERARLAAAVAPVGENEPTPYAVFLLATFGGDRKVAASLAGEFRSGSWTGHESDRLARQIEQLNGWRRRSSLPIGVRQWARQMVESLEHARDTALQREAEERW